MPIRLLSDKVSSMIAAGEVIERPASVVKELVENALDAGATEISVEIRGGGVEQIRVADNGYGIPHDEVELAFQRFATSKLSDASDLDAIPTLGFRGEALPSIASVARLSVVTRHADDDSGTRLEITEGRIVDRQRQGASPGTAMTVRQLFRNVPARRKFLRTTATETSHIQNMVTRYALAYPEVRSLWTRVVRRFSRPAPAACARRSPPYTALMSRRICWTSLLLMNAQGKAPSAA